MNNDPLDSEVSASVEVTETGLKAKAKSRALSGIDRLVGNITEFLNIPMEERQAIRRARLEAQIQVMRAAADVLVSNVGADPEMAKRAIEGNFSQILRRQENKEKVAQIAIEQLKTSPPTDVQQTSGPEDLSDQFLTSFERHAEDASTDEIREKWASVLASEVKKPGSFTKKAMRILDEIEVDTANAFSEMSKHRVGSSIPMCLHTPDFNKSGAFIEHDLINSAFPDTIKFALAGKIGFAAGHYIILGRISIAIEDEPELRDKIQKLSDGKILTWESERSVPALPVVLCTATGGAILELMGDNSIHNAHRLASKIRAGNLSVHVMEEVEPGKFKKIG